MRRGWDSREIKCRDGIEMPYSVGKAMRSKGGLLALVCLFAAGCGDYMSDDDYSHAWRAEVLKYRALDLSPENEPADPGETQEAATRRAARHAGDEIRAIASEVHQLEPAPKYADLQEKTYQFYLVQAQDFQVYAADLETGDAARGQAASQRLDETIDRLNKDVIAEIDKLGDGGKPFKSAWQAVFKPAP